MKNFLKYFLVLLFFAAAAFIRFKSALPVFSTEFIGTLSEDMAHNHWTLAWDLHKLTTGMQGYWTPPYFTPLSNTLGFNDHCLGSSIFVLPVYLATHNTILCYNVIWMASFVLVGFFTFLIAKEVSSSMTGALLAGLFVAFGSYRQGQIDHLHMLSAQWGLLALWFGLRYAKTEHPGLLVGAFLALAWQCLSGLALGLLSFYTLLLFWTYLLIGQPQFRTRKFIGSILIGHLFAGLVYAWAAYPNLMTRLAQGYSWSWGDVAYGSMAFPNYATVSRLSVLSLDWMNHYRRNVHELCYFPGFIPLLILGVALFHRYRNEPSWAVTKQEKVLTWTGLTVSGILLAACFFAYRWPVMRLIWQIQLNDFTLIVLLATAIVATPIRKFIVSLYASMNIGNRFFLVLTVVSFVFSFSFFYRLLYTVFPGFDGMRVPARLAFLTQIGIFVLMAGAAGQWLDRLSPRKIIQGFLIIVLVGGGWMETALAKLPTRPAPDVSPLYERLEKNDAITGLLEIPFPTSEDNYPMQANATYFATRHWKRLVNGYSAFTPTHYKWLYVVVQQRLLPPADYLAILGVSHVVVHWDRLTEEEIIGLKKTLSQESADFTSTDRDGWVELIAVRPLPAPAPLVTENLPVHSVITASTRPKQAKRAGDGRIKSVWKTGRGQKTGDWLKIDFPSPLETRGIILELGNYFLDFPRGVTVEGETASGWVTLNTFAEGFPAARDFATIVATPNNPSTSFLWAPTEVRSLRVTLRSDHDKNHWKVAEIKLVR